jgi:hypothetical protein
MKLCLITYSFLLLINSVLFSQTNYIKNVRLYSLDGEFTAQPQLNNFLNDDILGAVNSGMNVTFHFYSEVYDLKKNLLKDQDHQIHVRNDIWENQYTITGYKFLKKFKEFENFKNFLLDSMRIQINAVSKINKDKKIQLFLTFSPQKISISQKEKIRGWLKNEDNESESTLSLNLSKLISFFLSEDKNENLSIYKSEIFTIKALKANEISTK